MKGNKVDMRRLKGDGGDGHRAPKLGPTLAVEPLYAVRISRIGLYCFLPRELRLSCIHTITHVYICIYVYIYIYMYIYVYMYISRTLTAFLGLEK